MLTEEQIQIILSAYEQNGIVTRNDYVGLNTRPRAKEVYEELQRRGYREALLIEPHLENYRDYSGVIFNSDLYDYKEVEKYTIKNILG